MWKEHSEEYPRAQKERPREEQLQRGALFPRQTETLLEMRMCLQPHWLGMVFGLPEPGLVHSCRASRKHTSAGQALRGSQDSENQLAGRVGGWWWWSHLEGCCKCSLAREGLSACWGTARSGCVAGTEASASGVGARRETGKHLNRERKLLPPALSLRSL